MESLAEKVFYHDLGEGDVKETTFLNYAAGYVLGLGERVEVANRMTIKKSEKGIVITINTSLSEQELAIFSTTYARLLREYQMK